MTTNVITVSADAPLQDVVRTMERRRVKRVPIVSDGKIVGIISRANVVQALARLVDELPSHAAATRRHVVQIPWSWSSTAALPLRVHVKKELFDKQLVPGHRDPRNQACGRQFSRWRRGEQTSHKSLCFTLATICGSVILSAVSIATMRAPILSSYPLLQFVLCLTGAKYQNRFCITDARNYLIVVTEDAPYNLFPAYHLQEPIVAQMTHWKANDQNGEAAFQPLILCALFLPLFPSGPRRWPFYDQSTNPLSFSYFFFLSLYVYHRG